MRRWYLRASPKRRTDHLISKTYRTHPIRARQISRDNPSLSIHTLIRHLKLFLSLPQFRLHSRQQDRVSRIAELDGGGVPGASDHQLGCDPVGQKTLGVVGCPSHLGYGVVNRGLAACLSRLQGTSSFPPTNKFRFYYLRYLTCCPSMFVILLACSPKRFMTFYDWNIILFFRFSRSN